MKKILHIQVLPKLSGVQKVSLNILKSLPAEYDKYILFGDLLDSGDKADCIKQFEKVGVKVLLLSELKREICWNDIHAFWKIFKLCKKEKFDIVHTNSTKPGIIGRIAATLAGVPLVVHTVHGLAFHQFMKFPRWHFYWLCEMCASLFCDKIILVNQYYSKYFKWCRKKICTIYNGIDFSELPTPVPKVRDYHPLKILFVGRLDEQKDPFTMLKAFQIVCEKYPKTTFTLVGDGKLYSDCKDFIQSQGLQDKVNLVGWQQKVSNYYLSHDIFVMSSIYEAFGLVFLDAGYYNLPSVATDVEGIPEVVKDKKTGLLSHPYDHIALAQNVIYLIEHADKRIELGKNAHKYVTLNFNLNRMESRYLQIYESGNTQKTQHAATIV